MNIGAYLNKDGSSVFTVWAPCIESVSLHLQTSPDTIIPMKKNSSGYWTCTAFKVKPDTPYTYGINKTIERPDPASFYQPQGVHGPSAVVDHSWFKWTDHAWRGIPLSSMIIYELHVGTFTKEGTFDAVINRLDDLQKTGINAIEIMPVAQFPGRRNWGYDGTYLFAVQNSYGGPEGLKKLVNACHRKKIAVILDVVYNHLGPEGNYLHDFGPYVTNRYQTPWGNAVNYDGPYSCGVRNFIVQNMRYWFTQYHIDGLRLDAVHGIYDRGAKHILQELAEEADAFSQKDRRKRYLIAESDLNDIRVITGIRKGGYGIDAQWHDDFHHSLHTVLTREHKGYYADFGDIQQLTTAIRDGFVYSWKYSGYRKRFHGSSSKHIPASRLIACTQNHDQIGNRLGGEREASLVSMEAVKLKAGVLFSTNFVPLIFMGQEYAEDAPFLYFVDHSDQDLIRAVREGRTKEFESFDWPGEIPDPQDTEVFAASKLCWQKRKKGIHKAVLDLYQKLISVRKKYHAPADTKSISVDHDEKTQLLFIKKQKIYGIYNFGKLTQEFIPRLLKKRAHKIIESSDTKWLGPGALLPIRLSPGNTYQINPESFAWYCMEG
ncbi:MAG: malto-oligosyltrehalose trehalohydrolase [bacterium]